MAHSDDSPASSPSEELVPIGEVEAVIREMQTRLERLQKRNAELEAQQGADSSSAREAPASADRMEALAREVDELRANYQQVRDERDALRSQRDALREERDALQAEMEELDKLLPNDPAALDAALALCNATGVTSADEAEALLDRIEAMRDRMRTLMDERDRLLDAAGADSVDDALERLQHPDASPADARSAADARPTPQQWAEIQEILGISTPDEARTLEQTVRFLTDEVERLQETLSDLEATAQDLGVSDPDHLAQLIESMEQQLTVLYEDRKSLDGPTPPDDADADLFDQLHALHSGREKLESALGVSSPEAVIEMVDGLVAQLESLYDDLDADGSAPARDEKTAKLIASMADQLDELYRERDATVRESSSDAPENAALPHLEALRDQVSALQEETKTYSAVLTRLASVLDADAESLLVEAPENAEDPAPENETPENETPDDAIGDASSNDARDDSAPPPLVDDPTLETLEMLTANELNELPVGIIRLSRHGTVVFANDAALPVPGLRDAQTRADLLGTDFFARAPALQHDPHFRELAAGMPDDPLDARFYYPVPGSGGAARLAIQLHRKPSHHASWILFRRA